MEYIDEVNGYKVYRNADGFLEGYKTTGIKDDKKQLAGGSSNRLVTECTTIQQFAKLTEAKTKLKPKKQEPPSLFP